jgi:hypothetical protein
LFGWKVGRNVGDMEYWLVGWIEGCDGLIVGWTEGRLYGILEG